MLCKFWEPEKKLSYAKLNYSTNTIPPTCVSGVYKRKNALVKTALVESVSGNHVMQGLGVYFVLYFFYSNSSTVCKAMKLNNNGLTIA